MSTSLYYGANAPFVGGKQGFMSRQVDEQLIKNDLLQLLLTSPGERVMRLDFGTGIRSFLFKNLDDYAVDSLKADIAQAISQYERRVNVTEIVINPDPDNNIISIKIFGSFQFAQPSSQNQPGNLLVELNIQTAKNTVSLGG
jgi:phage baseplate assembly protein W